MIRIRIHLGPWIRIQGYKIKEKAEFNQKNVVFCKKFYFSSLKLKKELISKVKVQIWKHFILKDGSK